MSAANGSMYTWGEVLVGSDSKSDQQAAREFYETNWVENWRLATPNSKTPDGAGQGFNLTNLIRLARQRYGPKVVSRGGNQWAVEHEPRGDPEEQDEFGVLRNVDPRAPMPSTQDGWRKVLDRRYGHEDIFKAAHALQRGANTESGVVPQYEKVVKDLASQDIKVKHDVPTMDELDLEDPEDREIALTTTEEVVAKANIDSTTVSAATPIIIDPDLFNTVRTEAPHNQVIDQVVQAGFTASYNIISGRATPIGPVGEGDAMDLSNNTPQDFTLNNDDTAMRIWVDLVDVSDFAQRAENSLGFMDLFGTSIQQRVAENAVYQAKEFYYGDNSVGDSSTLVESSHAADGLRTIASDANGSYVKSKTSTSLDGDKALFKEIKEEILALTRDSAATENFLRVMTSKAVYNALENEANVSTRIDSFDGGVNFGGRALSILGVPIMQDPNIRTYTDIAGTATDGDVFIFDSRAVQDRVLAPFSTMPLGRVGLGDRAALFKYSAWIDKSQGQHTRVLQDYQVPSLPTV